MPIDLTKIKVVDLKNIIKNYKSKHCFPISKLKKTDLIKLIDTLVIENIGGKLPVDHPLYTGPKKKPKPDPEPEPAKPKKSGNLIANLPELRNLTPENTQ